MHPDDDLPPFLDGWDELSTALDGEPGLTALSGYATAWTPPRHDDGEHPPF